MGQYHMVVNLDRREYLDGHAFAEGVKLMEFGPSGDGTMMALAILLARDSGRGGGDFDGTSKLVGSWAGCRIAICGDYGEPGDLVPPELLAKSFKVEGTRKDGKPGLVKKHGSTMNVYNLCMLGAFRNISDEVIQAIQDSSERDHSRLRHINLSLPKDREDPAYLSRFEQVMAGENAAEAARIVGA